MKKFLIFCCCIMIGNVLCAAQSEKPHSQSQKKSIGPKKPQRKMDRVSNDYKGNKNDRRKKGSDYDQMQNQFAYVDKVKENSLKK